jgi:hypothetical protein
VFGREGLMNGLFLPSFYWLPFSDAVRTEDKADLLLWINAMAGRQVLIFLVHYRA